MYYFQNKILNVNVFKSYNAHSWSKRIANLKFSLIRYRNEILSTIVFSFDIETKFLRFYT
jgi:hypothetical protein